MNTKKPFTHEQVSRLWEYQHNINFHPFTCANRGDGKHIQIGTDLGMLIPTIHGWICPFCDYTQDWAHNFMSGDE